ncbi:VRR-NUC domain containing protein [uncultured Caudovirales phage]|uniref:VRR-NUC domain containing protein n=1 Tax=uncultured Caudovirales phage TaxID=2100421 RepID=A0A6J5RB09_9CAUD|nr:VRR-NUC domain containing protein [uncultured Caudovirales phage]
MSPEKYAEAGTEHAHQVALLMWSASMFGDSPELRWMFAIPNGGDRNPIVAARLKAEGVKSGVSDLCLPFARRGYHGFYIELKKPGGKASDNQLLFGKFLASEGYLFSLCDHWEIARDQILWYIAKDVV